MNEGIAMMLSILIVMFGYLVFKILTDQSQSTPTTTRKRSKKRGTGKPVIKNNWNPGKTGLLFTALTTGHKRSCRQRSAI